MNILLVDDHGIFREGTALLLKSLDPAIEVAHARTARECLDNAATMNFDLVLLDLGLPDKPGLAALSDLKHAHPDLPVVVLSGHEERETALEAITVSDLRFGVAKSAHRSANAAALDEFLSRFELLDYPVEASASYGKIRTELDRAGTPIGNNDLLIVAHAMSIKANVATANIGEFQRVKGLKVLDWLS